MMKILHPVSGTIALLTILCFWISTAVTEAFAGPATIAMVKSLIPWGFLLLIPAMAGAGLSGIRFGKTWRGPIVARKQKRMPVIAANGILVLIPAALYLSGKAQAGAFDTGFYIVQALELMAGAVNITLLALNMRDGLRLSGKLPRSGKTRPRHP